MEIDRYITETARAPDDLWPEIVKGNGGMMGRFADISKYPEIVALCEKIVKADKLLRKLSKILPYRSWWNEAGGHYTGWEVAALRYVHIDFNPLVPFLRGPEIRTAGFATLEAGYDIKPHTGHTGDAFRLHYGLDVPDGDCCFRVGHEVRKWGEGKFFMFNDNDMHAAWNNTEHNRTVFIVEIDKKFLSNIEEQDIRV